MKEYVRARLGREDRAAREELKRYRAVGVRATPPGLYLVATEEARRPNALAGHSVGKRYGPFDLSSAGAHLEGFGE